MAATSRWAAVPVQYQRKVVEELRNAMQRCAGSPSFDQADRIANAALFVAFEAAAETLERLAFDADEEAL